MLYEELSDERVSILDLPIELRLQIWMPVLGQKHVHIDVVNRSVSSPGQEKIIHYLCRQCSCRDRCAPGALASSPPEHTRHFCESVE